MQILNEQPTDDAPGETIVLDLLKRIETDWIAIHQLPLRKKHKWDPERKPDFVFAIPYHGVLILEIKSSPNVHYRDGGFKVGTEGVDPLQQIEDCFYNLREWHKLRYANTSIRGLTMACTLGFTAASPDTTKGPNLLLSAKPENHHRYQVAYAESFKTADAFQQMVINALSSARAIWPSSADSFGPEEVAQWAEARMPSAPVKASRSAMTSHFIRSREDFTEQQQRVYYELLRKVPKVFIAGAWGTGKTFLAKHIAVRSAIEGRRVCIVVKRKELLGQLADEIGAELTKQGTLVGSVEVTTVDRVLERLSLKSDSRYDELVLDQAEDFLDLKTLEALGGALSGGWSPKSRVKIFADFDNQGYHSPTSVKEVLDWLKDAGFVGIGDLPLSHNLRNGKAIAREVEKIGRTKVYTDYLPEEGQVRSRVVDLGAVTPVMTQPLRETPLRTWNVSQALIDVLKDLKKDGYEPGDVVVLTALPRRASTPGEPTASQSSPAFVALGWDYKLPLEGEVRNGRDGSHERPYQMGDDFKLPHDRDGLTENWIPVDRANVEWEGEVDLNGQMIGPDLSQRVTWCTVEEFAGCESTVVVLTDVHMAKRSVREKRLTRGLSRASQRAVLVTVNVPKTENEY